MGTKHPPNSLALTGIIVGCSRAMCIDIINFFWRNTGHLQRRFHGKISSLPVIRRRCLVKSITGIAVTRETGPHGCMALGHR